MNPRAFYWDSFAYVQEHKHLRPDRIRHPKGSWLLEPHHLVPRVRGGGNHATNLLWLWEHKHRCWHRIFGEMTLAEVVRIVNTRKSPYFPYGNTDAWRCLFGKRPLAEIETLLHRVYLRQQRRYRRSFEFN